MAARLFPRLSTAPIIVWTVNGGSTPTIRPITLVKGDAAPRVGALIVRIMCGAPAPPSIAVRVTASFMVSIVCNIMWSASNVNPSNAVASVRLNTPWFPTNVTSAGTPNASYVGNGYPSRTTNVTFNL